VADKIHTYIGSNAVTELIEYCRNLPEKVFTLVADHNTFDAMGKHVYEALGSAGLEIVCIVLEGDEVIADERYLMQVFLQAPVMPQMFLAVGSGTITDITRYVSYRTGNHFISIPTAPSVDGFISLGAPLVINGLKDTFTTHAPQAVFADLDVLSNAPSAMIAAGFGDIIGKLTSLADWKLENLLWGGHLMTQLKRAFGVH
jgi:glycerol-1-phosphate dehydrogenase [NAD(P)+]